MSKKSNLNVTYTRYYVLYCMLILNYYESISI